MRYCCPACDGEDVRKLSVVYNSGVSDLNISGGYIGFGRSDWGYIQANGSKVSRLAQSCAPPEKFSFFYFCGLIGFAIAWCLLAELGTKITLGIIFIAYTVVKIIYEALLSLLRIKEFELSPTDPFLKVTEYTTWKAELSGWLQLIIR